MSDKAVSSSPHSLSMARALFSVASSGGLGQSTVMVDWQPAFLGVDLVDVRRIQASLAEFGTRFERRLFTDQEILDAGSDHFVKIERLATRFAAKEAAIKAFGLGSTGVNWRELEVTRRADGAPMLQVHGKSALHLQQIGASHWALSLSHDGDQAIAIVAGFKNPPATPTIS